MPGPPTPVSDCLLSRLEIRDGGSTRVYHSSRPNNIFALTLEGERSINANSSTLIFLIHHGARQLISIRLHDLLKNSQSSVNLISTRPEQHEIYIRIPRKDQAILAQLEEKRDFNMAVYMLKRSNLHISQTIPPAFSTVTATATPRTFPNATFGFRTASVPGTRLSSITDLPPSYSSTHNDPSQSISFTELLNNPPPSSSSQPVPARHSWPPQRIHSLPVYLSESASAPFNSDAICQQPNTPSLILSRSNSQVHPPRIASPLRQSFGPEEMSRQPLFWRTESNPQLTPTCVDQSLGQTPLKSITPVSSSENEHYQICSAGTRVQEEHERSTSADFLNERTRDSAEPISIEPTQNFRDLMPKPRKLPFNPAPRNPKSRREPVETPRAESHNLPRKRKATESIDSVLNTGKSSDGSIPISGEIIASTERVSRFPANKEGQVDTTPPESTSYPHRCQPPPNLTRNQLSVLAMDTDTLRHLNQATSQLFDQYVEDVQGGKNKGNLAKFYAERITTARTAFWLARLEENMSFRQWHSSS